MTTTRYSLLAGGFAAAYALAAAVAPGEAGPARETGGPILIGAVRVDAAHGTASFTGHVNQDDGLVELLACGPGGKTHETVFVSDADPVDLQASLLLLGLRLAGGTPCGDPSAGRDAATEIWIEWPGPETTTVARAESVLFHRGEGRALSPSTWIFTGSETIDGVFMASEEESLIATYCDRWAILNLSHPSAADDTVLAAHGPALPPPGTAVTIRIRALRRPAPASQDPSAHSSGGDG